MQDGDQPLFSTFAEGLKSPVEAIPTLEAELDQDPSNRVPRARILGCAMKAGPLSAVDPERFVRHMRYLVETCPDAKTLGLMCSTAIVMRGQVYQDLRPAWEAALAAHPDSADVLINVAAFLAQHEPQRAIALAEEAGKKDPEHAKYAEFLKVQQSQKRLFAGSNEDEAKRHLSVLKAGLSALEPEARFCRLTELARTAFSAGTTSEAKAYAQELLSSAPSWEGNWNQGNAIHCGNVVLGLLALSAGSIEEAKGHLLASGQTRGSPQLNSFGPSMRLARDLLEQGEREVVLEYLELCTRFWKMDMGRLAAWKLAIGNGGIPDFMMNLRI
jgi:tetratricopeptide (TPR) repeat protein